VIDVVTAVFTATGEQMTSNTEQMHTTAAAKPAKKGSGGKRTRHGAAVKVGRAKRVDQPGKTPRARREAGEARPGSKTATILELLRRPNGAALKELMKATGWQPHSIRGFLSGTIRRKMKLSVMIVKREDGERTYSVEA
jgi:hypothetical protein